MRVAGTPKVLKEGGLHSAVMSGAVNEEIILKIINDKMNYSTDNGTTWYPLLQAETDPNVPDWAKAAIKPSYDFSEIDSKPNTLSGYGITDAIPSSEKAANNGVATLDAEGHVPLSQMSDTVLGQMLHAGEFNAATAVATLTINGKDALGTNTNTITLTNDTTAMTGYTSNQGNYYITTTAGTFAGISFIVGDWLVAHSSGWGKIDNTDAVASVNNKTGVVVLDKSDIGLGNLTNDKQVIAPSTAKGETTDKTLTYGDTFKVLQITTAGEVNENTMTMPAAIDISGKANNSELSAVAKSGDYNDLTNKPTASHLYRHNITRYFNGTNTNFLSFTLYSTSDIQLNTKQLIAIELYNQNNRSYLTSHAASGFGWLNSLSFMSIYFGVFATNYAYFNVCSFSSNGIFQTEQPTGDENVAIITDTVTQIM